MADIHSEFLEDEDFDTILSPDIEFSGIIIFEKPFLIRGKVTGFINATGVLVVDTNAVIEANINASRVIIRGIVTGNINATVKVEISSTGRLAGNIITPEISFESGCVFNGLCTMHQKPA
jgi:cytoskeletal protein CcmA (bactofilin family)